MALQIGLLDVRKNSGYTIYFDTYAGIFDTDVKWIQK